jgi:ribulose-5-phosphate 4-epimerase/fuculose-1-phosphate aldolase
MTTIQDATVQDTAAAGASLTEPSRAPVTGGPGKTLYFSLEPEAEVAVLARMLAREGYDDHNWGHITYLQPDGTILMNAWEVPWSETRASDIIRVDAAGAYLSGQWTPTPAVSLHLATHRLRPDVRVAVHHHPRHGSVWAAVAEVPGLYLQSHAVIPGEVVLYDEFQGDVTYAELAERNVRAMGDNYAAILANHGVFVVAENIKEAHYRAVSLEQRCALAWQVRSLGPDRGRPLTADAVERMKRATRPGMSRTGNRFFHAMIRAEILADPSVLT